MTYRELAFYILDSIKAISDDSSVTIEHIVFLLDKYRLFLIELKYSKSKELIASGNTQTICLDLELYSEGICGSGNYLRSTKPVPNIIDICTPTVSLKNLLSNSTLTYVNSDRFRYAGTNKYTLNIIYCTIAPDNYLYLKSINPQFTYLQLIKVNAVFEDPMEAAGYLCDSNAQEEGCVDVLDTSFCMELALVPQLLELVEKELLGVLYRPKDDANNSADDMAELVSYVRRNMKSDLAKQLA